MDTRRQEDSNTIQQYSYTISMTWYMHTRIQGTWNTGTQEYRNTGIQEYGNTGIREYKSTGTHEY